MEAREEERATRREDEESRLCKNWERILEERHENNDDLHVRCILEDFERVTKDVEVHGAKVEVSVQHHQVWKET